jgi:hypothetical protein
MSKMIHEIRDPIHIFIKVDTQERTILDSRPFQRLRYIHQLAMTYLVYPGRGLRIDVSSILWVLWRLQVEYLMSLQTRKTYAPK